MQLRLPLFQNQHPTDYSWFYGRKTSEEKYKKGSAYKQAIELICEKYGDVFWRSFDGIDGYPDWAAITKRVDELVSDNAHSKQEIVHIAERMFENMLTS